MAITTDCQIDATGCATVGHGLYWAGGCVSYSVAKDGSELRGISYDQVQAMDDDAVSQWMDAECSGGCQTGLSDRSTGPAQ